jgi:hypothetical protein
MTTPRAGEGVAFSDVSDPTNPLMSSRFRSIFGTNGLFAG